MNNRLFYFRGESNHGPFRIYARSLDHAFEVGEQTCKSKGESLVSVNNISVEFNEQIKNLATDCSDIIDI